MEIISSYPANWIQLGFPVTQPVPVLFPVTQLVQLPIFPVRSHLQLPNWFQLEIISSWKSFPVTQLVPVRISSCTTGSNWFQLEIVKFQLKPIETSWNQLKPVGNPTGFNWILVLGCYLFFLNPFYIVGCRFHSVMIIEVLPPIWPSVLNLIEPAIYIERSVYACYKSIVWIYFVNKLLGFLSVNEQSTCTYKKATAPLPPLHKHLNKNYSYPLCCHG